MITTTVRDYLDGKLKGIEIEGVYIFKDNDYVLYVGKSVNIVKRLGQHLKPKNKLMASGIGAVVWLNAPLSLNWKLELMTPEDCRPYATEQRPIYKDPDRKLSISNAEYAMIYHCQPYFNGSNSLTKKPLPNHIRTIFDDIEAGATDKLF